MADSGEIWLATAITAGVVYATRVAGAMAMTRVEATPGLNRFLDGLAMAVIAAVVGSMLAGAGLREVAAVALAGLTMRLTGSAIGGMCAACALAALWSAYAP